MVHTPAQVLEERLAEAATLVEVGAHYAHYKHPDKPYKILALALLEENEEVAVVYEQLQDERLTFIRPLASFLEGIEVGGKTVLRFLKVAQ